MTNFAKLESDQANNLSINTKIIFSPDNRNAKKNCAGEFLTKKIQIF